MASNLYNFGYGLDPNDPRNQYPTGSAVADPNYASRYGNADGQGAYDGYDTPSTSPKQPNPYVNYGNQTVSAVAPTENTGNQFQYNPAGGFSSSGAGQMGGAQNPGMGTFNYNPAGGFSSSGIGQLGGNQQQGGSFNYNPAGGFSMSGPGQMGGSAFTPEQQAANAGLRMDMSNGVATNAAKTEYQNPAGVLPSARPDQNQFLQQLQQRYGGYGPNADQTKNQLGSLGGAETFITGLMNTNGSLNDQQRQQFANDALTANQLAYGGTSNSHLSDASKQAMAQQPYQAPRENPFDGQNMNDASVQFQLQKYMQSHPDFVPMNTYKGEAPRLPGEINQDTGMRTMDGVSGQNPWATNKGFVQMPAQQQNLQQYQAPQQQNPYLQPFQQTQQYQKAMSTNYASQNQPQAQSYWGNNQGQSSYGGQQGSNYQSPFTQSSGFGKNQFQNQGLLGGSQFGNQFGKKSNGLLG